MCVTHLYVHLLAYCALVSYSLCLMEFVFIQALCVYLFFIPLPEDGKKADKTNKVVQKVCFFVCRIAVTSWKKIEFGTFQHTHCTYLRSIVMEFVYEGQAVMRTTAKRFTFFSYSSSGGTCRVVPTTGNSSRVLLFSSWRDKIQFSITCACDLSPRLLKLCSLFSLPLSVFERVAPHIRLLFVSFVCISSLSMRFISYSFDTHSRTHSHAFLL